MCFVIIIINSFDFCRFKALTYTTLAKLWTFLPRDALQCKMRSCYRMSFLRLSVCTSVLLWRWWIMTTLV